MTKTLSALLLATVAATASAQTNLEQYLRQHQLKPQAQSGGIAVQTSLGDPEKQADAFSRIYATFCLKHINELEKLRQRMTTAPQVPKEKAVNFLQGYEGEAWLVPEQSGQFVIALPKEQNLCFVYGFRAGQESVEKRFAAMANAASGSMTVKKVKDDKKKMPFGMLHTLSYEWTVPGSPKKTTLKLSTTDADDAPMQVYASAALETP
jgi:hypothetical protein